MDLLQSLNGSIKKILFIARANHSLCFPHFSLEAANERFMEDLGSEIGAYDSSCLKIHK